MISLLPTFGCFPGFYPHAWQRKFMYVKVDMWDEPSVHPLICLIFVYFLLYQTKRAQTDMTQGARKEDRMGACIV
jgi:hypothetical protein